MTPPRRKRPPKGYYIASPEDLDATLRAPRKRRIKSLDPSELQIQGGIVKLIRVLMPGAVVHASPNGALLAGNQQDRAIAMARLKAAGMLVGFPDLHILWRGIPMYLEVKTPTGETREGQIEARDLILAQGGRWALVRSQEEAKEMIEAWKREILAAEPTA